MSEQSTAPGTDATTSGPAITGDPALESSSTGTNTEAADTGAGAAQVAIAAAQPRGVAVESTTVAGEQPRATVRIARGPQDRPEEGIFEGEAMILSAHREEGTEFDVERFGAVSDAAPVPDPTPRAGKRR